MRRAFWFRSVASLLALWLPLVTGEPGLLQPCSMHGAGRLVLASFGVGAPAVVEHGGASSHAHHAAAAASDHSNGGAPSDHSGHQCSCIDGCTVTATAFVAPAAPTASVGAAEYAVARSVPTVKSLARPAPEYSRPYTTGPPRA